METTNEAETYRIVRREADGVEFIQMRTARGFGRRTRITALKKGGLSKALRDLLNTNKIPQSIVSERGWIPKTTKKGIIYVKKEEDKQAETDNIVLSKINKETAKKFGKNRKELVAFIQENRRRGFPLKTFTELRQFIQRLKEEEEERRRVKIQQFDIEFYTQAPKRIKNHQDGTIFRGDKAFTPYLPQGTRITVVGDVNKLNKLKNLSWETLADNEGISQTQDLVDVLKSMGEDGYFASKRIENTESLWTESNTLVKITNFKDSPNVETTQPIDFRSLLVRDDPGVGHLPSIVCKYMDYNVGECITPYKSNYINKKYQPSLCWLSCIIDAFSANIEYLKKKRQTGFINLLSYQSLAKELFGDEYNLDDLKERGICWEDVRPFFEKYKIKAYLLDIKLQVRDAYIPEKMNQSIRPSVLYFVVHNRHVYRLNTCLDEIEKTAMSREVVMVKDERRPFKHISLPSRGDKDRVFFVISGDDENWVEEAFGYAKQAIQDQEESKDKELKKVVKPTTVFIPQIMLQELPFYLYQNLNVKSQVSLKDFGTIDSVRIYKTTFTSIDNHICGSIEFKGEDMGGLEFFFEVFNETKCGFMNREWLSVYHPSIYKMLTMYKPNAISTGTGVKHSSVVMWDIKKCYTSIVMNHLRVLPVFNGMDKFMDYDGSAIQDWSMYLVQRLDDGMSYPYYRNSVVFGYNMTAYGSNVKILGEMRPSHLVKSHLGDVLKDLFKTNEFDETEYSKNPHKWIANTCIGLLNRDRVSRTTGELFNDLAEASKFVEERKGHVRIVSNGENDEQLYLHIENGFYSLKSGFLPIAHFIVDTGNRLIMELKRDLESCGLNVCNILTDCCQTEQDDVKEAMFRERFGDKWFKDGFGSLRVEHKDRKSPVQKIRDMENVLMSVEEEDIKPIEVSVENEWELDEIHGLMDKYERLGVEAIMPGSGKTYCSKKYQKKTLFVVPTNKIRANLLKDGLDAITVCSLLGGDLKREDAITDYTIKKEFLIRKVKKTLNHYECIVFDEMMLNNIDTIYRIKRFLEDYGHKFKVVMNYDPFQNKAVGERLNNVRDVRAYKLKIIREMCGHFIILKEMKRNTNKENTKHYLMLKSLLDKNDKKAMIQYVLENCKVEGRVEDIKTKINISYRNTVREQISNHVYKMIHGDEPWGVGQVLIYKGKSEVIKGVKGVFFKNVEYEIIMECNAKDLPEETRKKNTNLSGNIYELRDSFDETFFVPISTVKRNWVLPYCWTGHAYQGDTIDQPFTIDVNDLCLIDCEWIWTAITRTTDWSHISIYYNKMIQKNNEQMLRRTIDDMIEGHARTDYENKRFINDLNEYINTDYVMAILNTSCAFCGDPYEVGGCTGSFSIDRIDNSRAHTKDNCRIICRMCNSIKR